jgi:hypothetical protein
MGSCKGALYGIMVSDWEHALAKSGWREEGTRVPYHLTSPGELSTSTEDMSNFDAIS